jgi:hypothetical protein
LSIDVATDPEVQAAVPVDVVVDVLVVHVRVVHAVPVQVRPFQTPPVQAVPAVQEGAHFDGVQARTMMSCSPVSSVPLTGSATCAPPRAASREPRPVDAGKAWTAAVVFGVAVIAALPMSS